MRKAPVPRSPRPRPSPPPTSTDCRCRRPTSCRRASPAQWRRTARGCSFRPCATLRSPGYSRCRRRWRFRGFSTGSSRRYLAREAAAPPRIGGGRIFDRAFGATLEEFRGRRQSGVAEALGRKRAHPLFKLQASRRVLPRLLHLEPLDDLRRKGQRLDDRRIGLAASSPNALFVSDPCELTARADAVLDIETRAAKFADLRRHFHNVAKAHHRKKLSIDLNQGK